MPQCVRISSQLEFLGLNPGSPLSACACISWLVSRLASLGSRLYLASRLEFLWLASPTIWGLDHLKSVSRQHGCVSSTGLCSAGERSLDGQLGRLSSPARLSRLVSRLASLGLHRLGLPFSSWLDFIQIPLRRTPGVSPPAPRRLCTHILSLAVLSFSASEEPLKLTHCAWRWSFASHFPDRFDTARLHPNTSGLPRNT